MGMIVQHNMNALNAYNALNANVTATKKASEKLSSGYRINRAGDDAAGLAISEKMRSQLKGLNQAVRNSQDGINMIQTFEGAAQETHSILQRMKELATESANGTYDNATDRAAIQLEFEQLNDELNQIADTDFNGTIVLNGGVMADGLEVNSDNQFNYKEQVEAAKAFAAGEDVATKLNNDADAAGEIIRNHTYGADAANALWDALGLDVKDTDDVQITFVYDETSGAWNASAAFGMTETKAAVPDVMKDVYNAATVTAGNTAAAADGYYVSDGAGGYTAFVGTFAGGTTYYTKSQEVDVPGTPAEYDMTNITSKVNLDNLTVTPATGDDASGNGGFTVSWKDADGNEHSVNAVFDAYPSKTGDHLTIDFKNTTETTYAPNNIDVAEDSVSTDDDALSIDDIDISVEFGTDVTDAKMDTLMKNALDELNTLEFSFDGTDITATGTNLLTVNTNGEITYKDADNNDVTLATITAPTATLATGKTIEFKLKAADYNVANLDDVKANSVETSDAAWTAVKEGSTSGVTKANAFDNSTAIMSYAENITLQTGARTKDAVNFSFQYNTDGSADMGDLKANLNLSARADGLNTANLTLANQDDANYAIDQIDKAINKTSMVRATFGAIQNRLEHKITNLTTTAENLQEAESAIRDTDMASEMMNYTKYNILQQAAQSMLAQANQQPQSILQLLG